MPVYKTKDENFFKRWSPEMAYVLGFFAADGSMTKNKRGAHFIEFSTNDKTLLERIRNAVGSDHVIAERSSRNPNWRPQYRLQIGSKKIFHDLLKLGLTPSKSLSLKFPKVPKDYLDDFVRGYFDGDGCVHLGRYWRKDRGRWKWQFVTNFTSGSKLFLVGLWGVLRKCMQGGRIGKKTGGYELVFAQHDSVALFRFMYHDVKSSIFLKRKFEIFQKAFKILDMRA